MRVLNQIQGIIRRTYDLGSQPRVSEFLVTCPVLAIAATLIGLGIVEAAVRVMGMAPEVIPIRIGKQTVARLGEDAKAGKRRVARRRRQSLLQQVAAGSPWGYASSVSAPSDRSESPEESRLVSPWQRYDQGPLLHK